MSERLKILAFAASNSKHSINRKLAEYAGSVLRDEIDASIEIESLDLNDYEMPIYSPEREQADGVPQLASEFFARIGAADGLIISFAEYNGSYTSAFKNIFDWTSRIKMKIYQDKPVLALATSIGSRGGENVLKVVLEAAPYFGADIKASLSFGPFAEHFDPETNRLATPDLAKSLRKSLLTFHAGLAPPQ